jgi:hypothetical protein
VYKSLVCWPFGLDGRWFTLSYGGFPLDEVNVAEEAVEESRTQVSTQEPHEVSISVENYLPENTPTYYSDGMVVVHTANEFILSFLQTNFPLAGSKEELEAVTSLKRNCIARIIMTPAQFEMTANALLQNFQKYQESYRKPQ